MSTEIFWIQNCLLSLLQFSLAPLFTALGQPGGMCLFTSDERRQSYQGPHLEHRPSSLELHTYPLCWVPPSFIGHSLKLLTELFLPDPSQWYCVEQGDVWLPPEINCSFYSQPPAFYDTTSRSSHTKLLVAGRCALVAFSEQGIRGILCVNMCLRIPIPGKARGP